MVSWNGGRCFVVVSPEANRCCKESHRELECVAARLPKIGFSVREALELPVVDLDETLDN